MEAEGQMVLCYRIFSKTRTQILVFLALSGFVTSKPWKYMWNVSPSGENKFLPDHRATWLQWYLECFAAAQLGLRQNLESFFLRNNKQTLVKLVCVLSGHSRGWAIAHTVVTIFTWIIWLVLSIELSTYILQLIFNTMRFKYFTLIAVFQSIDILFSTKCGHWKDSHTLSTVYYSASKNYSQCP